MVFVLYILVIPCVWPGVSADSRYSVNMYGLYESLQEAYCLNGR